MPEISAELKERIKKIKLVVMDVDGVLTDGTIWLGPNGTEFKPFNVLDGTGIKYLHRAGLKTAIITGRHSPVVEARAAELGIKDVFQGVKVKMRAFEVLLRRSGISPQEACYIGDDLPDLPVMRAAGFSATVPGARPEILQEADYVAETAGGKGAARELAELILKVQDKWEKEIMARYREGARQ